MKPATIATSFVFVVAITSGWLFTQRLMAPERPVIADYKHIPYRIDGTTVQLALSQAAAAEAPDSTVEFFGNEAYGDINNDKLPDVVFLVTRQVGEHGVLFYAVAALQESDGSYVGTNGVLLGDRIAPQTTEIRANDIAVNYAVRKRGEPMTKNPSIAISKYLRVRAGGLVEDVK